MTRRVTQADAVAALRHATARAFGPVQQRVWKMRRFKRRPAKKGS